MYVMVSIFMSILVPIVAGVFYAIRKKQDAYDPENEVAMLCLIGLAVAWAWPIVIPLALLTGVIVGIIAATSKITTRIMEKRKASK